MLGYQQASYVTFAPLVDPQTGLTYQAPNGSTSTLSTANAAKAVVLRSKAWGQDGGNDFSAQLVDPKANNAPLRVTRRRQEAHGQPGHQRHRRDHQHRGPGHRRDQRLARGLGALRGAASTARAPPTASSCRATSRRSATCCKAPPTIKRGPQDQWILRIGNDKGKPQGQKVGVFLYCQEHGGEIATSGVCLETMSRLVKNYGTDPATTSYVDNLDIFILPFINADGGTHSIYDSPRRTNMARWCEDTTKYPENLTDPTYRNSYGVNINRNFSVGSVFDGFQGASITGCAGSNFAGPAELSEPETRNEIWVQNTFPNIKFANNIHSSGGYFMWVPGAYTPKRETLPYPPTAR